MQQKSFGVRAMCAALMAHLHQKKRLLLGCGIVELEWQGKWKIDQHDNHCIVYLFSFVLFISIKGTDQMPRVAGKKYSYTKAGKAAAKKAKAKTTKKKKRKK
jgi:hypothetical protein